MRLYEFEGNDVFRQEGIPAPDYLLATDPAEARAAASKLGLPVVIKAQVLTGGRGLAGGVQVASTPDEVEASTKRILAAPLKGEPVHRVMVTRKVEIERELYLGVMVDGFIGLPVAIIGTAGGVSVEKASQEHAGATISRPVPITTGLTLPEARKLVAEAGLAGADESQVAAILHSLYATFRKYDALIAEINPLARTPQGTYLALDAKLEIDDSSLFRHTDLQSTKMERLLNPLERKGAEIGVTYVDLDGDIGIIASGAGLGMATVDIVAGHFQPANFLETGGGITADLLYQTMDLILQKKGLRAIFINLYGGINRIDEGAKGIVRYMQEHRLRIPVFAKALGNKQEETWEILREGGVHVTSGVSTEEGVAEMARFLSGER